MTLYLVANLDRGLANSSEPHWPRWVQSAPCEVRESRAPWRNACCGLACSVHWFYGMFYRMAYGISRASRIQIGLAATAALVLLWGTPTVASAGSAGGALFNTYCAACHGADARGNGPVASVLRVQPPDLTLLTRRFGTPLNGDKVAEYIDGRVAVMAHGPRDMPVWGNRLQDELLGRPATEDTVRRTIDSIVMYLVSIQQIRGAAR